MRRLTVLGSLFMLVEADTIGLQIFSAAFGIICLLLAIKLYSPNPTAPAFDEYANLA